jgi:hypothetical protein
MHNSQRSDNKALPVVEVEPPTLIDYIYITNGGLADCPGKSIRIRDIRKREVVDQEGRCSAASGRVGCTVRRTPRGTLGSRLELHRKVEVNAQLLSRRGSQPLLQSSVLSFTPMLACAAFRAGGGIEGKEKLALPVCNLS